MATWSNFTITDIGRTLLASALADNESVEIVGVKTSSKDYSDTDVSKLDVLADIKQSFNPTSIKTVNNTTVKIEVNVSNVGVSEEYEMKTIGVYAKGEQGTVLFAVSTAVTPDIMSPVNNGTVKNIILQIYLAVSSSKLITVYIDWDTYVTKGTCIDLAHPVHSVYLAIGGSDPATLFGGTWKKLEGRYIRTSGTLGKYTFVAGQEAGDTEISLQYNQMPAHAHTRGTMNITGTFPMPTHTGRWDRYVTGAFWTEGGNGGSVSHRVEGSDFKESGEWWDITYSGMDASRSWTGATSVEGQGAPISLNPAYIVLDAWLRIA